MGIKDAVEEGLLQLSIDDGNLIPDEGLNASGDVTQLKNGSPRSDEVSERNTALICLI